MVNIPLIKGCLFAQNLPVHPLRQFNSLRARWLVIEIRRNRVDLVGTQCIIVDVGSNSCSIGKEATTSQSSGISGDVARVLMVFGLNSRPSDRKEIPLVPVHPLLKLKLTVRSDDSGDDAASKAPL